MEKQSKMMSTLVNAQNAELIEKVEGACTKSYGSIPEGITCGSGYNSNGGTGSGSGSTSEELDILI